MPNLDIIHANTKNSYFKYSDVTCDSCNIVLPTYSNMIHLVLLLHSYVKDINNSEPIAVFKSHACSSSFFDILSSKQYKVNSDSNKTACTEQPHTL